MHLNDPIHNGAALLLGYDRATMQSFWQAMHSISIFTRSCS